VGSRFKKMARLIKRPVRWVYNRKQDIKILIITGQETWLYRKTVVQAKEFFLVEIKGLNPTDDLHFMRKKSYIPIDVCLLIDASGSMAGDKRQAACYLAEHLLLTGRKSGGGDISGTQQQSGGSFTRNERILRKGLSTISPAGLTPLADGIMTAVNLFKNTGQKIRCWY
jgi:magnesium chelatase subunit D